MRPLQKMAWYNLGVVALVTIVFLVLFLLKGFDTAIVALTLAGFIGFCVIFLRRKKGEAFWDERDRDIERQSSLAGLWVFFVYYVAFGVFIMVGHSHKPIEYKIFVCYFWFGFLLFFMVQALAVLVLYGTEAEKPGSFLEGLRRMTKLQKEAWLVLLVIIPVQLVFLLKFPVSGRDIVESGLGFVLFLGAVLLFFVVPVGMTPDESDRRDEKIGRIARKAGLRTAVVTFIASCLGLLVLYALEGTGAIYPNLLFLAGFCSFSLGLLIYLINIPLQYTSLIRKEEAHEQ